MKKKNILLTVGHSDHSLEDFIELMKAYNIEEVVDIRTIPRSRHNPQFNFETLPKRLRARGIGYKHMKGLGGLRHALKDSINMAWENASFRGFADYMQTEGFKENLEKLIEVIGKKRTAIMCAEVLPWRCHRSLVADALAARKIKVAHIFTRTNCKPHKITAWAKIDGRNITYPLAKK